MNHRLQPRLWLGVLSGLLLTAPMVAIFYAGWRLAALTFAPFSVFDWMTRALPGGVVTFGIDTMVRVIRSLHVAGTATAAKTAEQAMAVLGFLIAGMLAGLVLFAILRFAGRKSALAIGLIMGGLIGIAVLMTSKGADQATGGNPVPSGFWIMALFLAWGGALGWVYRRFSPDRRPGDVTPSGEQLTVESMDRRRFVIRLGGSAAVIAVLGAVVGQLSGNRGKREMSQVEEELWSSHHALPNADAPVKPASGTRPELTPVAQHYRIDINTAPPVVQAESWRLKIGGLVERPLALTLDDLRRYEPLHQFITLSCISNPVAGDLIGTTRWTGASLKQLLPDLKLRPNATHLKIHAADSFYEIVALDTIKGDERVMLAYDWDGVPLAAEHGFPLRIYIPDVYGMKQPKWIESIEATDHWEPGYWVVRGWDREARMKATSVIDTIAVNMMIGQASENTRVPVGGIAHAGARGISKVEVRVDNGPWELAQLRSPLSGQTWVLWRYDWPFQKGKHTFTVRCFDGQGAAQITDEAPPHPSGASGLHTRSVML